MFISSVILCVCFSYLFISVYTHVIDRIQYNLGCAYVYTLNPKAGSADA